MPLSPEQRADLLIALATEAQFRIGLEPGDMDGLAFTSFLRFDLRLRSDLIAIVVRVILENDRHSGYTHMLSHDFANILNRGAQAGGVLTRSDRILLVKLADRLEKNPHRSLRESERETRETIATLNRLAQRTPDALSAISERLDAEPSCNRLRPPPPFFDFWCDFFVAVSREADMLAKELKAKNLPDWTRSEAKFAERFPEDGLVPREFAIWRRSELGLPASWDRTDFKPLRNAGRRTGFAEYRGIRSLGREAFDALSAEVATLADHDWSRNWIPAADLLAADRKADDLAFVAVLAETPDTPTPGKAWLKRLRAAADAIGVEEARRRVAAWLEVFHRPGALADRIEDLNFCHAYGLMAATFELNFPAWRSLDAEALARLARWVALVCLAYPDGHRWSLHAFVQWERDRRAPDAPKIIYPDDRGQSYFGWGIATNVYRLTLENELLLRGAIWALAEGPGPDTVEILERTATVAIDRVLRARAAANAALNALAAEDSPAALEALTRLRRAIKDKAIANMVAKLLAKAAAKQGIAAADLEELGAPSYGFH
ncbi:hypothetical protein M2323_004153 [Rhodoblastus acidophilus]|uniref:hypothetical protein n=1 Tax=Rhodoblastus acidophilus TaxID=1074 RepID=UPI002224693E|nr:hypothetical protein [Rhodoblastus acidophilus]MCW2286312.1 hypothetical protein [Rhodoblastus acidophilus]MCW2335207.1 hypothetical protein [Rhodoblastus acidophilus]